MVLLRHLNLLIDEMLIQSEFHRFLDLPLELRYNVYEQYFLDNTKSNFTAHWPALHVAKLFGSRHLGETYRPSILPNLCVVNKVLRQELMACLLDPMGINFQDAAALASFDGVCLVHKFKPFHLVAKVRNATFPDVNANAYRILLEETPAKAAEMIQRTKRLNTTFNRLLPSYSGLRYLNIALYSPGIYNSSRMVLKVEPVREYMQGLSTQSILGLKELQAITITARNCDPNLCCIVHDAVVTDAGNTEHLRPVFEFAEQIKDGFTKQGRDVRVDICFEDGKDLEEQKVLL
jgi:hypothetical protein